MPAKKPRAEAVEDQPAPTLPEPMLPEPSHEPGLVFTGLLVGAKYTPELEARFAVRQIVLEEPADEQPPALATTPYPVDLGAILNGLTGHRVQVIFRDLGL